MPGMTASTTQSGAENKITTQTDEVTSPTASTNDNESTGTPVPKRVVKLKLTYSSRKEETIAKMTEKYGGPGSKDDYRDTDIFSEIRPPTVITKNKMKANTSYLSQIRADRDLRHKIKAFINEHWWDDVCKSANTPELHSKLFEPYMFDKDGVLDRKNPAFGKIIEQLAVAWMHIRYKYGEDEALDWAVSFQDHKKLGPYIVVKSKTHNETFGLTPPKTGWFDLGAELHNLRANRNAGKSFKIPDETKGYDCMSTLDKKSTTAVDTPKTLSPAAQGRKDIEEECMRRLTISTPKSPSLLGGFFGGSSQATNETDSLLAKKKAHEEYESDSLEDWDDYEIIEESETELYEDSPDDGTAYEEAKEEKIPEDEELDVYSKKDAKSNCKGWFW